MRKKSNFTLLQRKSLTQCCDINGCDLNVSGKKETKVCNINDCQNLKNAKWQHWRQKHIVFPRTEKTSFGCLRSQIQLMFGILNHLIPILQSA